MTLLKDIFAAAAVMGVCESLPHGQALFRPLQVLLSSGLEVPLAAWGVNPVDTATFEAYAGALDPTELSSHLSEWVKEKRDEQFAGADGCGGCGADGSFPEPASLATKFLHFILRTYVWHFLDRTTCGTLNAERQVVFFLSSLFFFDILCHLLFSS